MRNENEMLETIINTAKSDHRVLADFCAQKSKLTDWPTDFG